MFALNQTTTTTHTFGGPVETGAVDLYRLTIPISFPVDAVTQELVLDPANCAVNARFLTLTTGTEPNEVGHYPTNPMLGIAPQGAPADAFYFFSTPGELGATKGEDHPAGAPIANGITTDKGPFVEALTVVGNRVLSEADSPPTQVTLLLVAESNARCRLRIDTLKVAYRRAYSAQLAGSPEKQTLKLDAGRASSRTVQLQTPPTANIHSALLELVAKPAGAAPLQPSAGETGTPGGDPLAEGPAVGERFGLRVEPGTGAAQSLALSAAQMVRGVALALLPLTGGAALTVTLEADKGGRPDGAPLAQQEIKPGVPGRAGWYTAVFRQATLLSTERCWLVLRAGKGAVVWLSAAADAGGLPDVSEATDEQSATLRLNHSPAALLHRTLGSGADQTGTGNTLDPTEPGGTAQALRVRLGEQELTFQGKEDQTRRYDLQAALSALPGGSPATLPLTVTGIGFDLVTVYPPRIVYDG